MWERTDHINRNINGYFDKILNKVKQHIDAWSLAFSLIFCAYFQLLPPYRWKWVSVSHKKRKKKSIEAYTQSSRLHDVLSLNSSQNPYIGMEPAKIPVCGLWVTEFSRIPVTADKLEKKRKEKVYLLYCIPNIITLCEWNTGTSRRTSAMTAAAYLLINCLSRKSARVILTLSVDVRVSCF